MQTASGATAPALDTLSCAWVTPVLGVDGKLLYFGPLLRAFGGGFRKFRVVTAEFRGDPAEAGFPIEISGRFRRLYDNERATSRQVDSYQTGFSLTGPAVFRHLRRRPVDLLVINEFSLFAFFAALARFGRKTRILWVVETRPRLTASAPLRVARRGFRRLLTCFADAFLTNNREGLAYLTDELGVDPARIVASPYLVSNVAGSEAPPTLRRAAPGEPVRFLFVGQLLRRKGLQVAIEAARLVKARNPKPFVLEIVGDGPYRAELEAQVATAQVGDRVSFLGRQPYESLPAIYGAAHVFVFPTLADYRALTPFEALSSGLPIVASREDGGVAETVDEGQNGFSFDPARPEELARHLEHFLEHPGAVEAFSRRSAVMARAYTLDAALATLRQAAGAALAGRPR